ncbi:thiosulfate:glutathione sulfurtransferase [Polyodon spathula]|uniref:thiosulfate:glutathione sulfurtransferase n=1 Tax=Polyodon spathula TaxID=7913 RepID=UPI001B7EBF97|nr:thiosulfate:glutathione sulfurtransferase [Polyodon spathula]
MLIKDCVKSTVITMLLLRRILVVAGSYVSNPASSCKNNLKHVCNFKTSSAVMGQTVSQDKVVSYEQLKKMLESHNIQLFDVRSPEEFQAGRIPSSTNIPLGELDQALKMDSETFKKLFNVEKPQKQDSNIVFQCQSGKRSATALETAVNQGYTKAKHYAGGYSEWSEREGN